MEDNLVRQLVEENQELVEFLKNSRLFSHLSNEFLEELVPLSALQDYEVGTKILEEGLYNEKVYFLIRGCLGVYLKGEPILTLNRKGDIIGEMSVISSKPCSATVIATTKVTLFSIMAKDIGKYTDVDSGDLHNIFYRVFAMILTEKLTLTSFKAEQYEGTNRLLRETQAQLTQEIYKQRDSQVAIRKMNEDLVQANTELKETHSQLMQSAKLASLGEMATGVAHELNQPLQTIRLCIENLMDDYHRKIDLDIENLEDIERQIDKASFIIKHLKTFGRQAHPSDLAEVKVNEVLKESLAFYTEKFRVSNIDMEQELSDSLPMIKANPIQLGQVFHNLIVNAGDAMEKVPIKKLHVSSFLEADNVVVEFQDTGEGIPFEMQEKIFTPFFTTKEVGKGTGLGLSISYRIIEGFGGQLTLQSEKGKGTLFRVELPLYIWGSQAG